MEWKLELEPELRLRLRQPSMSDGDLNASPTFSEAMAAFFSASRSWSKLACLENRLAALQSSCCCCWHCTCGFPSGNRCGCKFCNQIIFHSLFPTPARDLIFLFILAAAAAAAAAATEMNKKSVCLFWVSSVGPFGVLAGWKNVLTFAAVFVFEHLNGS